MPHPPPHTLLLTGRLSDDIDTPASPAYCARVRPEVATYHSSEKVRWTTHMYHTHAHTLPRTLSNTLPRALPNILPRALPRTLPYTTKHYPSPYPSLLRTRRNRSCTVLQAIFGSVRRATACTASKALTAVVPVAPCLDRTDPTVPVVPTAAWGLRHRAARPARRLGLAKVATMVAGARIRRYY